MSFLCSVFIFLISLVTLSYCFTLPASRTVDEARRVDDLQINDKSYLMLVLMKPLHKAAFYNDDGGRHNNRVKRDTDLEKFNESKNLSQSKVVQLYLQLYKDLYTSRNQPKPIHPESIKPVLKRFKKKLITFFFPGSAQQD